MRPVAKPLLSFGGDEDDAAPPGRGGGNRAKQRDGGRGRSGVARAAAVAVTEVRVGASTQVSVAGTRLLPCTAAASVEPHLQEVASLASKYAAQPSQTGWSLSSLLVVQASQVCASCPV